MHSFGWKRKTKATDNAKPAAFQVQETDSYEVEEGVDWLTATKRPKVQFPAKEVICLQTLTSHDRLVIRRL